MRKWAGSANTNGTSHNNGTCNVSAEEVVVNTVPSTMTSRPSRNGSGTWPVYETGIEAVGSSRSVISKRSSLPECSMKRVWNAAWASMRRSGL